MRSHTIIAMVTLALLTGRVPAWATDFNERIECSVLVKAVAASQNRMDVRRATDYIMETFGILDKKRIAGGHQSLLKIISTAEFGVMIAVYITASIFRPG